MFAMAKKERMSSKDNVEAVRQDASQDADSFRAEQLNREIAEEMNYLLNTQLSRATTIIDDSLIYNTLTSVRSSLKK